jgi:polar amino acid transport system permease protein
MIPPLNNTYIELLKATSLVSAISVGDLIFESKALINSGSDRVIVMALVMLFYLLFAAVITLAMRGLERKAARLVGRDVKPLPWRKDVDMDVKLEAGPAGGA